MSKKNLVEETVASVKQAKIDAAKAVAETKSAPAPKARKRAKATVAEHCYGLLFGNSLRIKKTFATLTDALDHVKALPVTRAAGARLVTIRNLSVETRIAIQPAPSMRASERDLEADAPVAWVEPKVADAEEPASADDGDDLEKEPEEAE